MTDEPTTTPDAEEGGVPAWAVGSGLDTDMTGDPRPDSGKGLRFWMPKATEKKVIFLTEGNAAPVIWEHQFRMGGKWTNWATCLEPLRMKCGLCDWALGNDGNYSRSKVVVFTIIDTDKFTDKAGKERSMTKRLLVAKKETAELLKRKYATQLEEGRGLRGAMFKVYRSNADTSASVGTDFEYLKHVDLATLPDAEELPYAEILAPNPDAMKRIVERLKGESGAGGGGVEGTETEVDY